MSEVTRYTQMGSAMIETFDTLTGAPTGGWVAYKDYAALLEYKSWYVEAMVASNAAGYAGVDAANTIRDLHERFIDAEDQVAKLKALINEQSVGQFTNWR